MKIFAMRKFTANDLNDLARIGGELADMMEGGQVYGLIGDLGAGKTALVREIVAALGSSARVKSPTFSIMNEYPIEGHGDITMVHHLDLYRFEDPVELEALAMGDLDEHTLTFVEWPNIFEERAFPVRNEIRIEVDDEGVRTITVL